MADTRDQKLMDLVREDLQGKSELGTAELQGLLEKVGLADQPFDVQQALESSVREWAAGTDTLAFKPGGWKVKVSDPAVHAAISAGLIWAIFAAFHIASPIPAVLVPLVIPRLFSIDRVRLTRSEERIVANLALQDEVRKGTPDQLYQQLPEEIQQQLNPDDFHDLLEKIYQAGQAQKSGEVFEIAPAGKARFRVTFD